MKLIKCFTLLISLIVYHNASAQKEANIWHFGDGRCIDFFVDHQCFYRGAQ